MTVRTIAILNLEHSGKFDRTEINKISRPDSRFPTFRDKNAGFGPVISAAVSQRLGNERKVIMRIHLSHCSVH